MAIDARIHEVVVYSDGSCRLDLIPRPARRPGESPGIAGQSHVTARQSPPNVGALKGKDVWGGTELLFLGNAAIAHRRGYTVIEFVGREEFDAALRACQD